LAPPNLLVFGGLHDFSKHPQHGFILQPPIDCIIKSAKKEFDSNYTYKSTNDNPDMKSSWNFD
jgi:hypothetical protein